MILKKDICVKNPLKEEWGAGKVLENTGNNIYEVFFLNCGLKKFNRKQNPLVEIDEITNELFENINTENSEKFIPNSNLIKYFLENYEDGFSGDDYVQKKRNYKIKAKDLAIDLLNKKEYEELLKNDNYEEIVKRALKIINTTTLILPNEKLAIKNGLESNESKEEFSKLLFNLLYDEENEKLHFNKFCAVLESINANKWTIVSYFQFLIHSNNHMFIKPTTIQSITDIVGYDIKYKLKLNWNTYNRVQKFAKYLKNNITELEPKDMIDVQSFICCISEKNS